MLAKSGRGVRGGCVGFFSTSLLVDGSSAGVPQAAGNAFRVAPDVSDAFG